MHKIAKRIESIIENNLRFDATTEKIDSYILCCNKHLRTDVLQNKLQLLVEYLKKNYDAKIQLCSDEYILNDQKCINVMIRLQGENKTILTLVKA